MVKGISRQVIVVHSPDPKLFEQAIFILKEDVVDSGISDDALLKQAQEAIRFEGKQSRKRKLYYYAAFWAAVGSFLTGVLWLMTTIF